MIRVTVIDGPFSADAEISRFTAERSNTCGALTVFIGYCRSTSQDGAVDQLLLDHYPGFTETEIERLAQKTAQRHGIGDLLVIHRVGAIPCGEAIVLVAAQSSHRGEALAAVSELMDYLKTDAPLWKREAGPAGVRWIEPTELDRARRQAHGE